MSTIINKPAAAGKPAVASSTVTRDLRELDTETGNIYESIVIMSKRANQLSNNIKEELHAETFRICVS